MAGEGNEEPKARTGKTVTLKQGGGERRFAQVLKKSDLDGKGGGAFPNQNAGSIPKMGADEKKKLFVI